MILNHLTALIGVSLSYAARWRWSRRDRVHPSIGTASLKMRVTIVSVIAGAVATIPAAQAQDIQKGRQLAREVCAACHAVLAGQAQSPVGEAPSFEVVAATPGMTAMALNVWLTAQDHPTMPNIVLSQTDVQNVSAYILSLKK
ncbi:c-type cytochrome [Rhizobium jaguaris]|uniref:c-type cytochrome n=1 Tax=Rhizobium jaguaris TaxID=1312183 RepID=UPI0039BEF248